MTPGVVVPRAESRILSIQLEVPRGIESFTDLHLPSSFRDNPSLSPLVLHHLLCIPCFTFHLRAAPVGVIPAVAPAPFLPLCSPPYLVPHNLPGLPTPYTRGPTPLLVDGGSLVDLFSLVSPSSPSTLAHPNCLRSLSST